MLGQMSVVAQPDPPTIPEREKESLIVNKLAETKSCFKALIETKVIDGIREGHIISYLNKQFGINIFQKMVRDQGIPEY